MDAAWTELTAMETMLLEIADGLIDSRNRKIVAQLYGLNMTGIGGVLTSGLALPVSHGKRSCRGTTRVGSRLKC